MSAVIHAVAGMVCLTVLAMLVVVPASISGLGAVIENMQKRLLLLAEGSSRVVSLLPSSQCEEEHPLLC